MAHVIDMDGGFGKVWWLIFDYKAQPKYHPHHHFGKTLSDKYFKRTIFLNNDWKNVSSNGTIMTTARKIQTTKKNFVIGAKCKNIVSE